MAEQAAEGPGFIERFLAAAERAPDAPAVERLGAGTPLSYGGLRERMERYRGAFQALGLGPGEPVLLLLPPCADLIAAFYALASIGAIAVPLNHRLTAYELERIYADARPVGAVVAAPLGADRVAALRAIPGLRFILDADAELSAAPSPLTAPPREAVVSCHFTYKGLGYPLGVLHRYGSYEVCLRGLIACFPQEPGAAHLAVLPIYPVYGLTVSAMLPLSTGCCIVMAPAIRDHGLLDLLERPRVRFAAFVPSLYRRLLDERRRRGADAPPRLDPWLVLVSGGSLLPPELAAEVGVALGVEPLQGYGLTETLPVTASYPDRARRGTLGTPMAEPIGVRVMAADGADAPPGQTGEVLIGGPTLMVGYLGRSRETARLLRGGWLRTGDLGWLDEDGFLHFVGRRLAIAKVAAQMVDLVEVEEVIRAHPAIVDARATVIPTPRGGEQLAVSAMLKRGGEVRMADVIELCAERLSPHKVPRRIKLYRREVTRAEVGA